jgi:hypothetical protein
VKVALAAVSLLLAASMGGGFLLLPLLIPLHLWAARRSGRVGRVGWSLLPGLAVGMVVWAGVYTAVGEAKPAIWLVPVLASVLALAVLSSVTRPVTQPRPARFRPASRR